jgi:hypothetical protein
MFIEGIENVGVVGNDGVGEAFTSIGTVNIQIHVHLFSELIVPHVFIYNEISC